MLSQHPLCGEGLKRAESAIRVERARRLYSWVARPLSLKLSWCARLNVLRIARMPVPGLVATVPVHGAAVVSPLRGCAAM
jgi:hypothetical protein